MNTNGCWQRKKETVSFKEQAPRGVGSVFFPIKMLDILWIGRDFSRFHPTRLLEEEKKSIQIREGNVRNMWETMLTPMHNVTGRPAVGAAWPSTSRATGRPGDQGTGRRWMGGIVSFLGNCCVLISAAWLLFCCCFRCLIAGGAEDGPAHRVRPEERRQVLRHCRHQNFQPAASVQRWRARLLRLLIPPTRHLLLVLLFD